MTIPLPNVCEPSGHVVWALIRKFYIWEDLQVKEEGMGIKSEPQAK
jgi:hypothetical protein